MWKVDIELRRQSEEGLEQQEREQSQSLENVVVLDDNIVPVEFKNELPTVQNICLKFWESWLDTWKHKLIMVKVDVLKKNQS